MNIVLADHNELIRIGIRSLLSSLPGVEITGEAVSNEGLLEQIDFFTPDIIIIDYTEGALTIDVLPQIKEKYPAVKIIAITPEQSAETLVNALKLGVTSYVKKDCSLQEIKDCVLQTAKNQKFFCGKILEVITQANINIDEIDLDSYSCDPISLSEREIEIIVLIADGHTNTLIAEKLFLSAHTINTHRKNIMNKLGVKNTAGIVIYAVKTNLIRPNKYLFTSQ